MTKTPDETKKGLECCRNVFLGDHWKNCDSACPYQAEQSYCKNALHHDAIALIQQLQKDKADLLEERELNDFLRDRVKQLEAEKTKLLEESHEVRKDMLGRIRQLEAERDAAVTGLKSNCTCPECKYFSDEIQEPCRSCKPNSSKFEWRGIQKD